MPAHLQPQRVFSLGAGCVLVAVLGAWWWAHARSGERPVPRAVPLPAAVVASTPDAAGRNSSGAPIPIATAHGSSPGASPTPVTEDLREVTDHFAGLPVEAEREFPSPSQPRSRWEVVRLLRNDKSKYPLVRVIEQWVADKGGKGVRVRQQAMIADHVMIKLKPGARIDELLARHSALQPAVRRYMPASGLYVISFDTPDLDTVPRALQEFRRSGDLIRNAEPDWVAHAL